MVDAPFVELFRNFMSSEVGLEFFMRTIEDLPMAVILYDVTGENPEVVYLNRVARPVGIAIPEQIRGVTATEVFPASGRDQDQWVRSAAASGKSVHVSEYETGDLRIWEADIYPVGRDDAAPSYVLVMAIDVSEAVRSRRRADREREEQQEALELTAQRLEGLEKVKSDFLNVASHELRGPLAVLRGYLSMLSDGSLGELPPQARNALTTLTAKASQMALLVTQMLEAARLEDSQLKLKLEPVDMRSLVRRAVDTMGQLTAPGQSVLLEGSSEEILIVADPERIETIVVNLLDNALKYSPRGGAVRLKLSVADGLASVTVTDHGIGIAAEDVPMLFTRFGRIVTTENSHIPGTGLGLYLSREIARMHGGDISVETEVGRGSAFTLKLPVTGPE
ncbi:MAG: ATP-binding protein [Candidatus Dormibacteria bacterium]